MRILTAVVALALLTACGDPTSPGEPLTGTWMASRVGDWQNVTIDLTEHSPNAIVGDWVGFTQYGSFAARGVATGSRTGKTVTIAMNTDALPCGYGQFIQVTISGDTATGTTRDVLCNGSRSTSSSPITLNRQH